MKRNNRITVFFSNEELDKLELLAKSQKRNIHDQIRFSVSVLYVNDKRIQQAQLENAIVRKQERELEELREMRDDFYQVIKELKTYRAKK